MRTESSTSKRRLAISLIIGIIVSVTTYNLFAAALDSHPSQRDSVSAQFPNPRPNYPTPRPLSQDETEGELSLRSFPNPRPN